MPIPRDKLLSIIARADQQLAEVRRLQSGPTDANTRKQLKRFKAMIRRTRYEAERQLSAP